MSLHDYLNMKLKIKSHNDFKRGKTKLIANCTNYESILHSKLYDGYI